MLVCPPKGFERRFDPMAAEQAGAERPDFHPEPVTVLRRHAESPCRMAIKRLEDPG